MQIRDNVKFTHKNKVNRKHVNVSVETGNTPMWTLDNGIVSSMV